MKSTENKSVRLQMVNMHQFFIDKIDHAIREERYIEASWLIYSCIENRFFRVLQKYKNLCKDNSKKCQSNKNEIAISTKIECVKRLCESNVQCLSKSFSTEQLQIVKEWINHRNTLMHNLLSLDTYENSDADFKTSALEGQKLLQDLYESCTQYRKLFYADGYEFVFPDEAMEQCRCCQNKKKSNKKA